MMAVFPRGGVYWYEFIFAGKKVGKSAKTKSKTIASPYHKPSFAGWKNKITRVFSKNSTNRALLLKSNPIP